MTLLGSEHSLMIRSKFRSVLQLRLQQRRTREQLADQGIMPPLKSPGTFHEQRKNLERAKTEDYLKHKIRSRPERAELVNMHILQDTPAVGTLQATQLKLKRARLADDLNEKIAQRPGPLELVKKNIIPVDSAVKDAIDVGQVDFPKAPDSFSFEEDSSNEALTPEQPRSQESQGSESSPSEAKYSEASSPLATSTIQYLPHLSQQCDFNRQTPAPSKAGNRTQLNDQITASIPVPAIVKTKPSSDGKNQRHKKPKDTKPKVKKLKYHQYIPPDQKPEKCLPPMDSAYARLLQQQQLFLQLQILSQQQQQQQQHYSYQNILPTAIKQPGEPLSRGNVGISSSGANTSSSLSPVRSTSSAQAAVCSLKPGPLPSNLDDLKVSELRQQLRIRGLPVSGTKTALMKRLKPFQDCNGVALSVASTNVSNSVSEMTGVTFSMTPAASLSGFQPGAAVPPNGFYQFGSTSSTPPISPASSDLSVTGSDLSGLPDTFSDVAVSSPQYVLPTSPGRLCGEDGMMGGELEVLEVQKDKMLMEKQKVIEELTWKLHMEQKQVEELKMELQKQKRHNQPDHALFSVSIKQENLMSSCPFADQQINDRSPSAVVSSTSNCGSTESLNACGTPQRPQSVVNNHASAEGCEQNTIRSPPFLSPQCSPQHSPLGGSAHSPQHASLPPSPKNHFLLSMSPNPQNGDGRSVSPHQVQTANGHLKVQATQGQEPIQANSAQYQHHILQHQILRKIPPKSGLSNVLQPPTAVSSYSTGSANIQSLYISTPLESSLKPKSPILRHKMNVPNSAVPGGQKFMVGGSSFCSSSSTLSKIKQPPSYEDAVKQQLSRSQMDDLLDVLIESGEMPPNAKNDHPCNPKSVPQIRVSSGAAGVTVPRSSASSFDHMSPTHHPFDHCTGNSDNRLEALLNSHGSLSRGSDLSLLKMGGEDSRLDSMVEGFPGAAQEQALNTPDILENPLSPIDGHMSPSPAHGPGLNLGLTETPLESMDWLDLTPPSSATAFGSVGSATPSIFSADFLDVTELNLNTSMNLQW